MENILKTIYEDPAHEGSYGGVERLYRAVKDLGYTRKEVKEWLEKNTNYSIFKPVNRQIKRPRVIVSAMNQQWGGDTVNMSRYKKSNKFKYFLVLIDIFTRFVFTVPLQTLTGSEMKSALETIMQKQKPEKLRTDRGSEFRSSIVQSYLHSIGVEHFFTTNEVKENFCERVIQTLKKRLERIINKKQNPQWEKHLQAVTFSYNKSRHRIIKMSPMVARETKDWFLLWTNQYEKKERSHSPKKTKEKNKLVVEKKLYKFDIGDRVRLSRYKSAFERAYDQKWTDEIYTIISKALNQSIPQYKVKTWDNKPVVGKFYEKEMEKIRVDQDTLYTVEAVLKKEKQKGVHGFWVKWVGWGEEYNSWVPEANIVDIEKD